MYKTSNGRYNVLFRVSVVDNVLYGGGQDVGDFFVGQLQPGDQLVLQRGAVHVQQFARVLVNHVGHGKQQMREAVERVKSELVVQLLHGRRFDVGRQHVCHRFQIYGQQVVPPVVLHVSIGVFV